MGRFLQERAGPRRTSLVHRVVGGDGIDDIGVFGVLAADFKNGVHLWIKIDRRCRMGDDFVDDTLREGVQPRDLPARTADAQTCDGDRFRIDLPPHLLQERMIALAGGAHRISVGAQIHGSKKSAIGPAHKHGLGGGGTDVEPQQAVIPHPDGVAFDGFELDLAGKIGQRRQAVEGGRLRDKEVGKPGERGGFMCKAPQGGSQGFQVGRRLRHDQAGDLPAEIFDHHAVLGRAAGDHDVAPLHLLQQLQDLVRHHRAKAGGHLRLGRPFVGGMSTVRLAKHRAAARDVIRLLHRRPLSGLLQAYIQAAQLLQEKLPGPGSALVAGDYVGDASRPIQDIRHEGFTAGGNNGRTVDAGGFDEGVGALHRLRFRNGRQIDEPPELAAGGGNSIEGLDVYALQGLDQTVLCIALVGVAGMGNDARRAPAAFRLLFYMDKRNRRCPQTQTERFPYSAHACRLSPGRRLDSGFHRNDSLGTFFTETSQ